MKVRTNDRFEYDLTALLAPFADEGNLISVTVSGQGSALKAKVWLMRDLTASDGPATFVKRELLDYFQIEIAGAKVGQAVGAITFSGFTGPNRTGDQVTQTLSLFCDNSAPSRWQMGANTRGQFGGFPVHQYLPGNPQDWSLLNSAQFTLLKDSQPRTELGSGRSYPNGYARVVLNSLTYGGPPLVPPIPGARAIVSLFNRKLGISHLLSIEFVAGQTDVAPWPARDTAGNSSAPTTQMGMAMRVPALFFYGATFMLEEGDHPKDTLQVGFTNTFGTTTISGVAPGGCFDGDSKAYEPNPVFHDRLMTWRGRTPSVYVDRFVLDLRSINRTRTRTIGFRFTRMRVGQFAIYDGAGAFGEWNVACLDHVECARLGSQEPTTLDFTSGLNTCVISNHIRGQIKFSGRDFQFVGNRIETPANAPAPGDAAAFTGAAFTSDDGSSVAVCAFNLWINKQGPDSPLHVDYFQGVNGASLPGIRRGMRFYGNVIHAGKRRISTGTAPGRAGDLGKNLPGGAECIFMFDWGPTNWRWEVAANLIVESVYWGLGFSNPASGSRFRHNMLLADLANTNPVADHDKPTIDLRATAAWNTSFNQGIAIQDNIQSQAYIAQRSGIDADVYSGNLLGVQASWQIANLVNPTIGGAAKDIADIETAFSFKPGATVAKGPFHDRTLIDLRRHTADLERLFA